MLQYCVALYIAEVGGRLSADQVKAKLDAIAADRKAFIALLHTRGEDLHEAFAYGDGQTLFREALLIGDHTSYHTGEIILTRRLLGNWG